jgi:hypothetical protein
MFSVLCSAAPGSPLTKSAKPMATASLLQFAAQFYEAWVKHEKSVAKQKPQGTPVRSLTPALNKSKPPVVSQMIWHYQSSEPDGL